MHWRRRELLVLLCALALVGRAGGIGGGGPHGSQGRRLRATASQVEGARSLFATPRDGFSAPTSRAQESRRLSAAIASRSGSRRLFSTPPSALYATIAPYSGYAGSLTVTGTVTITQFDVSTLKTAYALSNLAPGVTGAVSIQSGTSCATGALGGDFWSTDGGFTASTVASTDPWGASAASPPAYAVADSSGGSSGTFYIQSGFQLAANLGRVLVVYSGSGANSTIAACGVLGLPLSNVLFAPLGTIPGYTGPLVAHGGATVRQLDPATLLVTYAVDGLGVGASGGVRIHSGTSCASISGDFYSVDGGVTVSAVPALDPWGAAASTLSPPTYTADGTTGAASGSFAIQTGFQLGANVGRVLVVHDANAAAVLCAVADQPPPTLLVANLDVYPGYGGALLISGVVHVVQLDAATLSISYSLAGLTPSTSGGVSIYSGTSCYASGGPYWSVDQGVTAGNVASTNPWGPVYSANAIGESNGTATIQSGFQLAANLGHALIVLDSNAVPAACGFLTTPPGAPPPFPPTSPPPPHPPLPPTPPPPSPIPPSPPGAPNLAGCSADCSAALYTWQQSVSLLTVPNPQLPFIVPSSVCSACSQASCCPNSLSSCSSINNGLQTCIAGGDMKSVGVEGASLVLCKVVYSSGFFALVICLIAFFLIAVIGTSVYYWQKRNAAYQARLAELKRGIAPSDVQMRERRYQDLLQQQQQSMQGLYPNGIMPSPSSWGQATSVGSPGYHAERVVAQPPPIPPFSPPPPPESDPPGIRRPAAGDDSRLPSPSRWGSPPQSPQSGKARPASPPASPHPRSPPQQPASPPASPQPQSPPPQQGRAASPAASPPRERPPPTTASPAAEEFVQDWF